MAAMWSSQEGSLLLWAWVLSIVASLALYATRDKLRELVPWATAVMAAVASFFTGLMLFAGGVNPFATLDPAPADGVGLNPLLQHPSMMIHPPMLYSGYVAFTVPFAFAIGALVTRRIDADWIRATRRFALIAWALLGFGLLLGARWSYSELGWGGYWAWDPVENAALMPWLVGTAFLHSIMVQEKRGMLKVWNACLIVATFSLALLGTFLVRSGVLQSIHAFGDSTVGPYILGLIAVVLIGSTALIVSRLDDLRSEKRIDSLISREAVFLVNNLLLVGLTAVIFWGTFFPLISELFTGDKASLAAPWFDRYTTPLAILLVLFTGIGPLLAWRRLSWARRGGSSWCGRRRRRGSGWRWRSPPTPRPALGAAALRLRRLQPAALAQEFWRGAVARRKLSGGSLPAALTGMVARNRAATAATSSTPGSPCCCRDRRLLELPDQPRRQACARAERRGERLPSDLQAARPSTHERRRSPFGAVLDVRRDGKRFALLPPSRHTSGRPASPPARSAASSSGEATSEVGLKAGLRGRTSGTASQPTSAAVAPTRREADEPFRAPVRGLVAQRVRAGPWRRPPRRRASRSRCSERTVARSPRLTSKQLAPGPPSA
jgi:cytochrome c-type biogenesis protein CcmF